MTTDGLFFLAINAGSSSIKFALYQYIPQKPLLEAFRGAIEKIGLPGARFHVKSRNKDADFEKPVFAPHHTEACQVLFLWLDPQLKDVNLRAVGHRIVQGGPLSSGPCLINSEVRDRLRSMVHYDPLHLPQEIRLVDDFTEHFPEVPQYASFDTSFHESLPRVAQLLPLPLRYFKKGIRRYGFHGLSYEYLAMELRRLQGREASSRRAIFAHLGSGSSLVAILDGRSIDTTMSFTPASGVPMGTRSGDIDPGLIRFFLQHEGLDMEKFDHMLQSESGLLGLSETSSDMQRLLQIENADPRAADAVTVYCYHIKKALGAFAAALGGVDTLVFSGGIGENAPTIRSRICENMAHIGIDIEENWNLESRNLISKPSSRVTVRVLHTDEERMIVKNILDILGLNEKGKI